MEITKLVVHAGRTLQHPTQTYANIRPAVTLEAALHNGDDPRECLKRLQIQAERSVEEHAAVLIASLEERKVLLEQADDIRRLERSITDGQQRLDELKARSIEKIEQPMLFGNHDPDDSDEPDIGDGTGLSEE